MKHITEHEFKSRGGNWLGAIRSWIQHNCLNGSDVTWGSHEELRSTKNFTPALLEEIASTVAWAAVKEDRERFSRPAIFELQIRDQKIKILASIVTKGHADHVVTTEGEFMQCPYCGLRSLNRDDEPMKLSEIQHISGYCDYLTAKKYLEEAKDV